GRRCDAVHVALDEAVREGDGGQALEVAHDVGRRLPRLPYEDPGPATADHALLDADRRVVGEPEVVERRQANPQVDVARVAVADQGAREVVAVQDRGTHQLAGRGGGGGRPAGRRGRRRRAHEVR